IWVEFVLTRHVCLRRQQLLASTRPLLRSPSGRAVGTLIDRRNRPHLALERGTCDVSVYIRRRGCASMAEEQPLVLLRRYCSSTQIQRLTMSHSATAGAWRCH